MVERSSEMMAGEAGPMACISRPFTDCKEAALMSGLKAEARLGFALAREEVTAEVVGKAGGKEEEAEDGYCVKGGAK